jgi:hypothetical protein
MTSPATRSTFPDDTVADLFDQQEGGGSADAGDGPAGNVDDRAESFPSRGMVMAQIGRTINSRGPGDIARDVVAAGCRLDRDRP